MKKSLARIELDVRGSGKAGGLNWKSKLGLTRP